MASSDETCAVSTPERCGLWFEDYEVGKVITSTARTITEADVQAFAGLSGDFNPLHIDEGFASRTAFRGRVAHGLLVESISSGLAAQTRIFEGTISALAQVSVRFEAPVKAGDTIHVRLEVAEMEQDPPAKRGRVRFHKEVFNQAGKRVLDGEWVIVALRDRARARGGAS